MRYTFADCRLDTASRELTVKGSAVHLSPKAFDLLRLLIEERPRVVQKRELMNALWPDTFVVEANLPVIVGEVRASLGDRSSASSVVKTHHGIGYSFIADVRETRSRADAGTQTGPHVILKVGTRRIQLGQGANDVGRDQECDVHLNDVSVSRRHARITLTGVTAVVEDLDSKNGTSVNGTRVDGSAPIANGDEILVGNVQATFLIEPRHDHSTLTI